jgi:hypothetical protein
LIAQDKESIFDQIVPDYSALEGGQGSNTPTLKRKPTLASITNLKRSKRQAGCNDGFKPSSPAVTRSKGKAKKKHVGLGSSAGKTHTFLIPQAEFPADTSTHPGACSTEGGPGGVRDPPPPTEVSTEVLLEAPNSEEESSNKLHIVPYGFF